MCSIELTNDHQINAVGHFIIKNNLITSEIHSMKSSSVDHRQDDGTFDIYVPGVGQFDFSYDDKEFQFCRNIIGEPVTARLCASNTAIHEKIIITSKCMEDIKSFCHVAFTSFEDVKQEKIVVFAWDASSEHWSRDSFSNTRTLESVILENDSKKKLVDDIEDFTSAETRNWYLKHGIPYHRGYLLHGPPGTGKTSTILAIATKLKRKLYRINLVAPRLCDNSLFSAFNNANENSIIVLEDVDALFGKFREKQEEFAVTFSGFINAIDGIGDSSKGMIYMFTSNYPDKLDAALRRPGRIDVDIKLGMCNSEQIINMFLRFYPNEHDNAKTFAGNIRSALNEAISPAQLQSHFIKHRKNSGSLATVIDEKDFKSENKTDMYA